MAQFLIDANLPYHFALWQGPDYLHVRDLDEQWTDRQIWDFARDRDLVIVSKDADFSDLAAFSPPPPRVVHVCFGNVRLREFHDILSRHWPWIRDNIGRFRMLRVHRDRVEAIADET